MSGYRCVNYYELCRLCTASHGTKTHIFSEEGKKKDLIGKIAVCLPVVIDEDDKLPKILCAQCLQQVETIAKFRETCINAQTMLESCLNSSKLRNGGKVYIKDVAAKKPGPVVNTSIPAPPLVKTSIIGSTNITKTQVAQSPVVTQSSSSDFLSSIIQAVGIQNVDDSNEQAQQTAALSTPQYTITLDGPTIKTNQIHYKIEQAKPVTQDQQQQTSQSFAQTFNSSSVDEFLKLKTNPNISTTIKKKEVAAGQKKNFDLILSQPQQQQKTPTKIIQTNSALATTPKTVSLQDLKFISPNKCYVPITIKDAGNDQRQIVAQFDTKNLVLPTAYLQMKIQPQQQIATIDGQHIVQLTAANLPNTISISPQQNQTIQAQIRQQTSNAQLISSPSSTLSTIASDTKCIFTTSSGQNVTITHQPLQSISSNVQQQQTTNQPTVQHQFIPPMPPLTPAPSAQTSTVETSAGKIQLTTLQNVSTSNVTHPLPQKSGITIQRIKQENRKLPTTKIITSPTSASAVQTTLTTTTSVTKPMTTTTTTARKVNNKSNQIQMNANNENNKSGSGNEVVPTCEVCEKVFKRKEHLAQHMKLHLGLRPFKCEEVNCNKAFSRKEHLMRHVISHTGKKMFSCEFCHKLFSRKDNLNKHRRSHETKHQSIVYTITKVE
ncbi:Specificity protein transcription factor 3 [Pseudolycoriella hygida]|uniref:Specificity protein transcription factor 3 n=1 Tax=Pseudolycoriella hygida TaxID=35572 RepID=A0A9Q0N6S8_9DIPT|nr:Specificity protein transcription factor 3 [Pseudolycoriella hygida]